MIFFVGDLHSSWSIFEHSYYDACSRYGEPLALIQVGDLNAVRGHEIPDFGFSHPCFFVDGNHDQLSYCREMRRRDWFYIPRWTVLGNTLFVGGAKSYDYTYRAGCDVTWSADEVLEPSRFDCAIDCVVSHTCASSMLATAIPHADPNFDDPSCSVLQGVLETSRPSRWWFGHFHRSIAGQIDGCDWRCLNIAEIVGYEDGVLSDALLEFSCVL